MKNINTKKLLRAETGGFTIIETILAMAVIVIGIVAVIALAAKSANVINTANDKIIATFLAQEAIEVVVNIRDTNWIQGEPWRGVGDAEIPTTNQGVVDFDSTSVAIETNPSFYCMERRTGQKDYMHGPPCNSGFNRHLEIRDVSESIGGVPVDFIEVEAIVDWSQGGVNHQISVVDHLYDWK